MAKGGGEKKAPKADPVKKKVGAPAAQAEASSLIRRRGLQSTKRTGNSMGGGNNFGGR